MSRLPLDIRMPQWMNNFFTKHKVGMKIARFAQNHSIIAGLITWVATVVAMTAYFHTIMPVMLFFENWVGSAPVVGEANFVTMLLYIGIVMPMIFGGLVLFSVGLLITMLGPMAIFIKAREYGKLVLHYDQQACERMQEH